ncbi:ATP-dependent Clp protease ATP-binding subunit [Halosquirtibacter xylanolyticus]|uniref:ATP-dependent Clp protease ATP-binding subunit n=1 Tax=Halosquirtibacter xylanolyticus TaxID=3374599 RepID=UPI0037495780|nr:ATP-dependent Clp protease ATP-binding subunit [Prolixibacteraceae bacterium]
MNSDFSQEIQDVLSFSREEAIRLGNDFIGTEHLFLGILREGALSPILLEMGVDIEQIKSNIEANIKRETLLESDTRIQLLKETDKVLKITHLESKILSSKVIKTGHLLLAILKNNDFLVTKLLRQYSVTYHNFKSRYEMTKIEDQQLGEVDHELQASFDDDDDDDDLFGGNPEKQQSSSSFSSSKGSSSTKSDTPVLDNFGVDITKAAEEGSLDPIVGRKDEIERIAQVLSRRKKNNPILIGEPGVGKSAIVEGLALRIVEKKVSRILFDKRVISLDLASIVAGTKYRGQFEERMKAIISELAKVDNVILFIDEIHTLVGAGGATGSLDAANILKPALARGAIQCIGATTLDEYRTNIEKDGALERRFQKVLVEPTSIEETIEILNNIKERYEDHHNVTYTKEAIEACVNLTTRYISDRHLPDKAIDALDETGSRVHINNIVVPDAIIEMENKIEDIHKDKVGAVHNQDFELAARFRDKEKQLQIELEEMKVNWEKELEQHREIVTDENVADVVAMMSGIPVQRIAQAEGKRLVNMSKDLQSSIIGQDDAIIKITKAIQRNRAGLKDPNKPIGSFIFLGPTGVGKTRLAKVLAEHLFDSTDALVRIDMSEYMEKFAVSRLVGAPPGYVGYEEGGQLTEKIRRKPYAVILLDEIEKAHPDVFNLLLQVLDEGRLTDSLGRKVDFRNTIIIMTSNIGSRQLKDFGQGVGFNIRRSKEEENEHAKHIIQKALKRAFAPEFLNRVDDAVLFNSLGEEDIYQIIDIEMKGLLQRVSALGYELQVSEDAKRYIAKKGYDPQFGARPLKRAIQKYIEDELAEVIIKTEIKDGDKINLSFNDKEQKLEFAINSDLK